MPDTLDAPAVRTWCRLALAALGQAREEIDALNVYPVPDGDTGTNLYLTVEAAAAAVDPLFDPVAGTAPDLAGAMRAMSRGALLGARGNSGVILAQLLRGMAEVLADGGGAGDHASLRRALRRAADAGYEAVARPVEGTVLTVAAAAARAAQECPGGLVEVAEAAHDAARLALAGTPRQLDVLARAGVVDAGGRGLVAVLGALADAVADHTPMGPLALGPGRSRQREAAGAAPDCTGGPEPASSRSDPAFEVTYLLDAPDDALPALRARLGGLGDSLVVVGGDGLWNVHVHVDDAGAAVEAGVLAGRPHRIRITHFGDAARARAAAVPPEPREHPEPSRRAVVSVVHGTGTARLCTEAGAAVLHADPDRPPSSAELVGAVRGTGAREAVLLLNDPELRAVAGAAADQLRAEGIRVAVIPTRSPVQGLAALAVHEPGRRFDEDVVSMTSAAGATRYAELAVAEGESWTMAGVCQAGDVLGLIDGDVAVIGGDLGDTGEVVLDRMLAAGGELLTLILGEGVPQHLADRLVAHVRRQRPEVDTVVYDGGHEAAPLLVGLE
ncbi:DAK2 domain-containing protein [Streptacidiphilus sp. ASG 303]|uniref:DAK2 domain-containing protein n=1 Tax=Streptacidiphilus sp. ASG 303 TaxID=2896847 RepID=UPI001E51502F|nr:DAK2 domain-containing protein [Streptacidiphilus sp. ASG 303]MCD0484928.1 DAK2 domain-containing protein [Streptacidiphilus sp. ASG 303]